MAYVSFPKPCIQPFFLRFSSCVQLHHLSILSSSLSTSRNSRTCPKSIIFDSLHVHSLELTTVCSSTCQTCRELCKTKGCFCYCWLLWEVVVLQWECKERYRRIFLQVNWLFRYIFCSTDINIDIYIHIHLTIEKISVSIIHIHHKGNAFSK